MRIKLTKQRVEGLAPAAQDVMAWDTELPGFGLKLTPAGRRIYLVQYKHAGRTRRVRIGLHGVFTADEARAAARELLNRAAKGEDPARDKDAAAASAEAAAEDALSFADLAGRYLDEHAEPHKSASSYEADWRNLVNHILPVLGEKPVKAIGPDDIARFHAGMRSRPGAGNRCLALLSKMFGLAEHPWSLRLRGSNPVGGVQHYQGRRMERFLSGAELGRLGTVLAQAEAAAIARAQAAATGRRVPRRRKGEIKVEPAVALSAIWLLLLTGMRRDEVLTLTWESVDLERARIRLTRHKTSGKTGGKTIALGAPAVALLRDLVRRPNNPFVFPGERRPSRQGDGDRRPAAGSGHFVGIEPVWARLRAQAGLTDVRLHDLRHTFASAAAARGESLKLIGALLGHSAQATTERYAHLADDPKHAAADRIAGYLSTALKGSKAE